MLARLTHLLRRHATLAAVLVCALSWSVSAGHGVLTARASAALIADLTSSPCADVVFYGLRGSGQPLDANTSGFGRQLDELADEIAAALSGNGLSTTRRASAYPAVSLDHGETAFASSVDEGVRRAALDLERVALECPSSSVVLLGYSQGAAVAHAAAAARTTPRPALPAAVVLISDPTRSAADRRSPHWLDLDVTRVLRHSGRKLALLGGPGTVRTPTLSVCRTRDAVCNERPGSPADIPDIHVTGYDDPGLHERIGRWVARTLRVG